MFRSIVVLLVLSFIPVFNIYATGSKDWKSFNGSTHPTPAEFEILQQDNNSILLEVTLNGINVQEKEINGKKFHFLSVPQASWTNESGKPKIPIIRTFLMVPPCNNMKVYMEDGDHISLKEYKAIPVGKKVIKNPRSEKAYVDEEFAFDEDFYSKNAFYPEEIARISFSGYLRDQKIVQLEIHPIKYNPQTKELVCYKLLNIRLSYDGVGNSISKGLGPLAMISQNSIINAPYTPMFSTREMGNVLYPERLTDYHSADYVIIAPEPFYSSEKLKQLASWRAQYSGLNVAVTSWEKLYYSFGGGISQDEMIRSFIKYVYNFWKAPHIQDGRVGYVLLVGDVEFIPTHVSNRTSFDEIVSTDNWYACVSGDDLMPDIMLGRLPAKSVSELNTIIDKIIQYEQNPLYDDWANNALLMSGTVESLHEDMKMARDEYLLPAGYNVKTLSVLDGDGPSNVASEINKGCYIIDYAGHGWINGWEIFQTKDIPKLKNDGKWPAIFSLACSTGYFDHPNNDSLAEALLKSRNGAIAFFGSSRLASISDVGFGLSEAVAVAHIYTLGEIVMHTKLKLLPDSINMELYNLMGDPALNLCVARSRPGTAELVITPVDISFNPEKPKQGQNIQINVKLNNFGPADAQDVVLELRDGELNGDLIEAHKIPRVMSNSQMEIKTVWRTPLGQAQHQIFVKAYPGDATIENYRDNNDAMKTLFVSLESEGWPLKIPESNLSAPVSADIDGDGYMELLIQTNMAKDERLYIWRHDGQPVAGWPKSVKRSQYDSRSHYYNSSAGPTPAVGDLDGDGIPEIVSVFFTKEIYAWKNDGSSLPGWPVKFDGFATTSPVLADLDNDGKMEVISGLASGEIQILRHDGTKFPGWPISINRRGHLFPIVIDMDSDNDLEIIASFSPIPTNSSNSYIHVWHHNGVMMDGWPVQMQGGYAVLPPAAGDLNGDGKGEVVVISNDGNICRMNVFNYRGVNVSGWPIDSEIRSAVALDDLDRDGDIEIIACSDNNLAYVWHHNGQKSFGWPVDIGSYSWNSSPVTGDIDGNGNMDIVFLSYSGVVHAYSYEGVKVKGWPAITEDSYTTTPGVLSDMDGDGKLEIAFASGTGRIHKLFLPESFASQTGMEWSMFGHDQMHTGSYNAKVTLPSPPKNLTAADVPNDKGNSISLSWQLSDDDNRATGYIIYRADKYDGKYSTIGKVPAGTSSYNDNTVKMGVTYWYVIRTSMSSYQSVGSNVASAYSINNFAPEPPKISGQRGRIDRVVDIWWTVEENLDIAGYNIYYGTEPGFYTWSLPIGKTGRYEIQGLINGTTYYIALTAFDSEGNESIRSNEIEVIPGDEDQTPPTFSTFFPKEGVEGIAFPIRCYISDPSGIFDDSTGPNGQGVYLIWDDDGELTQNFKTLTMKTISPGVYITDSKIPGHPVGSKIIYQIFAWDNDYDWDDPADRIRGISQEQIVTIVPVPSEAYNYPNPVSKDMGKTNFRYFVKSNSDADVTIKIYDISGCLVETIETSGKGNSANEEEWNVSHIASGIYIYTIEIQPRSGERQFIRKKLAIVK